MAKDMLSPGDRVAYAAKFLNSIGAHSGAMPFRRGTYAGPYEITPGYCRVRWDDFEANAAQYSELYGEDYTADAREHGQVVHEDCIAKVGSARFGCTDR